VQTPVSFRPLTEIASTLTSDTKRYGYCAPPSGPKCDAFVGPTKDGHIAWVLLADHTDYPRPRVSNIHIWRVRDKSVTLSEGIELAMSDRFATALATETNKRFAGRQVAPYLEVDSATGVVIGGGDAGCM
jgi:hypothetical protein